MDFQIYPPPAYLDLPLIKFSRFFPPPTIWTPRLSGTVEYNHMEEFLLKSIQSLDTSVEEEYLRSNYADNWYQRWSVISCLFYLRRKKLALRISSLIWKDLVKERTSSQFCYNFQATVGIPSHHCYRRLLLFPGTTNKDLDLFENGPTPIQFSRSPALL